MADNSLRDQRRDALGRGGAAAQRDSLSDDPLAELARLIGQSDPQTPHDRLAGPPAEALAEAAPPPLDWSALDEESGQHDRDSSGPAAYQQYRAADASWQHDTGGHEESGARPYSPPYASPPYSPPAALFDDALAAARIQGEGYGDQLGSAVSRPPTLPYIAPAHDGGASGGDGQYHAHASDYPDADAADGYQGEAADGRRRSAVVIVAVLGLVVVGTAGALGYHAMFGGSMIPSLPPIITPGNTPVKIVPQKSSSAGAASQADAKAGGDRLVPREEKPVTIQSADAMPRVVTTIPVIGNPAGESPMPGATPPAGAQQAFNGSSAAAGPPGPAALPGSGAAPPSMGAPGSPVPFDQFSAPASPPASGSKPVHTVIIKPVQSRPANGSTAPTQASARADRVRPPPSRTAREPQSRMASAAPLSIVPTQAGSAPPPARTRTAMAHASAPASSGPVSLSSRPAAGQAMAAGYAVQVSSQHSEAAARAEFRALQAKFPQQLGQRTGMIRRANLGAKGVYYRVLVGPFASAEQASSLCGSLKSAGASCLVQRN